MSTLSVRNYIRMKQFVEKVREHVNDYHHGSSDSEVSDDGERMYLLCNYIDALVEMLEQDVKDD